MAVVLAHHFQYNTYTPHDAHHTTQHPIPPRKVTERGILFDAVMVVCELKDWIKQLFGGLTTWW